MGNTIMRKKKSFFHCSNPDKRIFQKTIEYFFYREHFFFFFYFAIEKLRKFLEVLQLLAIEISI